MGKSPNRSRITINVHRLVYSNKNGEDLTGRCKNLANAAQSHQANQSSHINVWRKRCKTNYPEESLSRYINIRPYFSMTDQENERSYTHVHAYTHAYVNHRYERGQN